jgi:hypothetical protein
MQEALNFLLPDAEPLDRTDFIEQARLARRGSQVSSRGLPLTIRGLSKSFGDNEVLRGIDLHIPAGESSPSSAAAAVARARCCVWLRGSKPSTPALSALARKRARKTSA